MFLFFNTFIFLKFTIVSLYLLNFFLNPFLKYATIPLKRLSLEHLFWNDYKEIDKSDFNDKATKKMLFERIINNSSNILKDLSSFCLMIKV